jgi:MFS family permease
MGVMPAGRKLKLYPTFRGWWIVGVSFMGLFIHGSSTSYLFGILVLPMEEDLGWSRTTLVGALTVATFVTAGVGMIAGPWFDRHGARVGMTLSALAGGAVLVALGAVSEPWQYYLLLGVGIGVTRTGLENIGPRTTIANWFVRRRAAAFAWFSGGRAVFGAVAVAPIAILVEATSWRSGWILLGVAELALLVPLSWIVIRRRPEDHGQLPDGDAAPTAPGASAAGRPNGGLGGNEIQWTQAEAMRTRTFWLMTAGFVLTGFPATGLISNMVPYFSDEGLSLVTASWAFSMFGFGALAGRPFWGLIASSMGVHTGLTVYGIGYGIVIGGFVIAFNAPSLFAAAFLLGTITGGSAQLQAQAWPDYFGRLHVGAITGITTLLIMPAMATGPLIAALAFDMLGSYTFVFTAYSIGAGVAGVLFYLARRPSRSPSPAESSG